jgi:methyl-accepting chemotaxis protein
VASVDQYLLLALIVACAIGIFATVLTTRSVTRPLAAAGKAADEIAKGNLLCTLPFAGTDEIGELVVRLAIMRNNLHEIAAALRQQAVHMVDNLKVMENQADHAFHSADGQSSAAASLAAAVEQLSVSIDQISDHAQHALALSGDAKERAESGGQVMHQISSEISMAAAEDRKSTRLNSSHRLTSRMPSSA